MQECEDRYLYKISARNFDYGIFSEKDKGFIGIRNKFGFNYLDMEYHYDEGAPHGTVFPQLKMEKIPSHLSLNNWFSTNDELMKWLKGIYDRN